MHRSRKNTGCAECIFCAPADHYRQGRGSGRIGRADLRYAENAVDFDDDKLKLIGWAGRKAATPLAPPGQARLLEAPKQGEGWVFLDWKSPIDGGAPAAHKVMRRERPAGPWEEAATAVISEATLVEQRRQPAPQ